MLSSRSKQCLRLLKILVLAFELHQSNFCSDPSKIFFFLSKAPFSFFLDPVFKRKNGNEDSSVFWSDSLFMFDVGCCCLLTSSSQKVFLCHYFNTWTMTSIKINVTIRYMIPPVKLGFIFHLNTVPAAPWASFSLCSRYL